MLTKRGTGKLAVVSLPACAMPAASIRTSVAAVTARPSLAPSLRRRNGIATGPTFLASNPQFEGPSERTGALLERGHLIQRFSTAHPSVPVSARAVNDT